MSTTPPGSIFTVSTTPPGSISMLPPKKSRLNIPGMIMRRRHSSTAFKSSGIVASPHPYERKHDSDTVLIKGSTQPGLIKQLKKSAAGIGSKMIPSRMAKRPARNAAALASEPAVSSPLAGVDVAASPEFMLEPPIINEIPPTQATPAAEQLAPVAEPKVAPATVEQSVGPSFETSAPQPVVVVSNLSANYSKQIWDSEGQIPQDGISAKPSVASSSAHGNGNTGYDPDKPTAQMSIEDPHDADPNVSPADIVVVLESPDLSSPREDTYQPVISMPLPAMADVMPEQFVRKMASGNSLSVKSSSGLVKPVRQITNENIPLLTKFSPPQAKTVSRMCALGWSEYVLPDATIYFVHPTLRVITDIDLRDMKQLEIVTESLDKDGETFKVPQDCELWLRDTEFEGKRRECVPVKSWVDHGKRTVSSEPPWERDAHGSHYLHKDDKEPHRYRSFMEAHPAHTPISATAHNGRQPQPQPVVNDNYNYWKWAAYVLAVFIISGYFGQETQIETPDFAIP